MPFLFIRARNSVFDCRDEGAEYEAPEAALTAGMEGAMGIIGDEISRGERSVAIEISVEQEDGTQVLRSVMAMCISPLVPAHAQH